MSPHQHHLIPGSSSMSKDGGQRRLGISSLLALVLALALIGGACSDSDVDQATGGGDGSEEPAPDSDSDDGDEDDLDAAGDQELEAVGPLPIFEELDAALRAEGGSIEGNELIIRFNADGGPVTGEFDARMLAEGTDVGGWQLSLTGTYDPAAGTMSGDMEGSAAGGIAGVSAEDFATGTWTATVDLSAGTVTADLDIREGQVVVATIRDPRD